MSVMIDVAAYLSEVEAFTKIAERFAEDRAASSRLRDMRELLQKGVDTRKAEWTWDTPKEIIFKKSTAYDGPNRKDADTHLTFGFECVFTRSDRVPRRSSVWQIKHCATHVVLHKNGRSLPCHFDYKNGNQWGPQMHFQVSERLCDIPIPRVPTGCFLPTDCADLALAELHHEEWRRQQASSRNMRETSLLRDAQENRVMSFLADVQSHWMRDKRCTRVCMLQNYTSTVAALPDHKGRLAEQIRA
ncbi:hypothetical protein P7D22_14700 [Lichenihabitans sp. Uapishka_5]|uniref:hypothetical protein n=1 Tax=Lichenihabitans sp. Uapishka_5 TaxID=3037302 RepID=UPI0029E80D33|nr:hypothetical protein [Lichenihabitans sp. Uapishka_5]MDX7952418.1 hypothetical protein [Lichenihabitans sp. Uapishka_5]